ncbi:MAG: deoxycytidylate deaminase [Intestinibacter sp.]
MNRAQWILNGCSDEDFPWEREGDFLNTKYPYVVHAEQNAILNARGKNLEGCSIYVNLFPCHDCARNIIQSGIKKVYYLEDKYKDTDSTKASKFMFEKAKVECIRLKPRAEKIEISFKTQD